VVTDLPRAGSEHGADDGERDRADGEVDVEDPLPREVVGGRASEQRADERLDTEDRSAKKPW
jgi:hypothetical protein